VLVQQKVALELQLLMLGPQQSKLGL